MNTNDWISLVIAVYGAIVATVLGIAKLAENRVLIKVEAGFGVAPGIDGVLLTAANMGRRQVTLQSMALRLSNGKMLVFRPANTDSMLVRPSFPCQLKENEACNILISRDQLREELRKEDAGVVAVQFGDAVGHRFQTKFHLTASEL